MPNHVKHKMTVVGPADDVARFILQARGRPPATGDEPGHFNANRDDLPEMPLNFHSIVPLPPEYSKAPYGTMSKPNGYSMEHETWGTKWGAYDQEGPVIDEGRATYSFTCAWGMPGLFFAKASASWLTLHFLVSFGGEGPTRGRWAFADGEDHEIAGEDDGPEYPKHDEGNEDAWHSVYKASEEHFLTTHDEWVRGQQVGRDVPVTNEVASESP